MFFFDNLGAKSFSPSYTPSESQGFCAVVTFAARPWTKVSLSKCRCCSKAGHEQRGKQMCNHMQRTTGLVYCRTVVLLYVSMRISVGMNPFHQSENKEPAKKVKQSKNELPKWIYCSSGRLP